MAVDWIKDFMKPEFIWAMVGLILLLLEKCGGKLACILTRFQGHQVKYLLEIGLNKCIIEPVYARDISDLFN